jgi:hypothetical protein
VLKVWGSPLLVELLAVEVLFEEVRCVHWPESLNGESDVLQVNSEVLLCPATENLFLNLTPFCPSSCDSTSIFTDISVNGI